MTGLDALLFFILIISAFLAYSRGFVRELLSIGTWVLAALFTRMGAEKLSPYVAELFGASETVASIISYIFIFVFGVFLASFIVKKLASQLHKTDFKAADQALGFIFGLFRGFLITSLLYLFVLWLIPQEVDRPQWFADARSRPALRQGAYLLDVLFIPNEFPVLAEDMKASDSPKLNEETYKSLLKPTAETEFRGEKEDLDVGYSHDEIEDLNRQLRQIREMEKLN
ncbi:MAG: CvpA family protein [Alphaproteobacteria bacterium]|nr:CvpA family protein [Alphaproteobacteria bacterium]MBN2780268.1 CvpA family protein [Alphaproteobacteria bacterium]